MYKNVNKIKAVCFFVFFFSFGKTRLKTNHNPPMFD